MIMVGRRPTPAPRAATTAPSTTAATTRVRRILFLSALSILLTSLFVLHHQTAALVDGSGGGTKDGSSSSGSSSTMYFDAPRVMMDRLEEEFVGAKRKLDSVLAAAGASAGAASGGAASGGGGGGGESGGESTTTQGGGKATSGSAAVSWPERMLPSLPKRPRAAAVAAGGTAQSTSRHHQQHWQQQRRQQQQEGEPKQEEPMINISALPIWQRPYDFAAHYQGRRDIQDQSHSHLSPQHQNHYNRTMRHGEEHGQHGTATWLDLYNTGGVPQHPYDPTGNRSMNILLLYADDWRYDTLGAAGNTIVSTPALDDLSKQGIRFTHNCVTTSVCWVSRVSMFASLYLSRHNTTKPREFYLNWNQTVYDLMQKEGGYHVGHIGKWGVNHPYKQRPDFEVEEDGWHYDTRGGRLWHVTEKNEADALRFLESRPRDKPFFANVAFFATHAVDGDKRQYLVQNKSRTLYEDDVIPDPPNNDLRSYNALPEFFEATNEGRTRWRWRYETPDKQQHMMKNYYRMASEVDSACDLILKELYLQGELDRTLVIFTTDNGNYHAEHGLADKWYPHQESIRVPLIIRDPRMSADVVGTINEELTLNIDLAPTMLAAAGITAPDHMMGRDMAQLYLGTEQAQTPNVASGRYLPHDDATRWRSEFFYEHPIISHKEYIPSSEALVRKDYKYFYWPDYKVEQLFHLAEDPGEDFDLLDTRRDGGGVGNLTDEQLGVLTDMRRRFAELKKVIQRQQKRNVIV
mmetsp:Transcript_16282/g.35427  ORF Transcript_16282/g.35427 Transcript_16282/m.35427 type:complete len:746 (+) Transcript_16282:151-2388(+)